MKKYVMLIDGTQYEALFQNDQEFVYFKWENEACGDEVELLDDFEVSVDDIKNDTDFEEAYIIEILAQMLLSNYRDFKKVSQMESELRRLGFYS